MGSGRLAVELAPNSTDESAHQLPCRGGRLRAPYPTDGPLAEEPTLELRASGISCGDYEMPRDRTTVGSNSSRISQATGEALDDRGGAHVPVAVEGPYLHDLKP